MNPPYLRTKFSGVYVIECLVNGRTYIGESSDIYMRWNQHAEGMTQRLNLEKRKLTNYWLAMDCKKYGIQSFTCRVHPKSGIAMSEFERKDLEELLIKQEQPYYNVLGK